MSKDAMMQKILEEQKSWEIEQANGAEALKRLLPIAQGHSGQCRIVAKFLLGLYNGTRFPFNMIDFRSLDAAIFEDCITVLRMDSRAQKEVHMFFKDGGKVWEQLAIDWDIKSRSGN